MGVKGNATLVDLEWSFDGDFVIRKGDLSDTKEWIGKGFVQECEDRIKSEPFDWKLDTNRGAGLDAFRGENNTEEIRDLIEKMILASLTRDGFIEESLIAVSVAPLSRTEVIARVDINVSDVDEIMDSEIILKIVYDLQGQGPFILR